MCFPSPFAPYQATCTLSTGPVNTARFVKPNDVPEVKPVVTTNSEPAKVMMSLTAYTVDGAQAPRYRMFAVVVTEPQRQPVWVVSSAMSAVPLAPTGKRVTDVPSKTKQSPLVVSVPLSTLADKAVAVAVLTGLLRSLVLSTFPSPTSDLV